MIHNLFFIYRPVQVLAGHDKSVKCVALSAELDMAVSGSEDGTVNIYSIKEGQFMRFLKPPNNAPEMVRYQHFKGVSDLEMCMDYFALQEKN